MAIDFGWDGWIEIGSSAKKTSEVTQITEWTLEMSADALEKTNFGSTYDREYTPGMRGWTGSLSGYSEDADNVQAYITHNFVSTHAPYSSTAVHAVFISGYTAGTTKRCGFKGNGILTGMTRGAAPDGLQTFAANIQGSGRLTTYAT